MRSGNGRVFWPLVLGVVVIDVATKVWAIAALTGQFPFAATDKWLRWTLVYNPGAAFGLSLGSPNLSRWIFMGLTLIALGVLSRLYQSTVEGDRLRVVALALVCAGAAGNLIDRIFRPAGVVDFIDIGFHSTRWPTFNVADMAVSIGAVMLAWVLWDEDQKAPGAEPGLSPGMAPAPAGAAADGARAS